MSTKRQGPPKHQNRFAWNPNAGHKINPTEVGGNLRPYSEITGVCQRCKDQIDWKRRYGKYKPLSQPAKCQRCSKRAVRQAYHNLCLGCAKKQHVCAKCCCHVDHIVGRDSAAEQKMLEDALKNARERDRRTLLRAMNKRKSKSSTKPPGNDGKKVGDLFPDSSLDEYAAKNRLNCHNVNGHNEHDVGEDGKEEEEEEEEEEDYDDFENEKVESEAENEEDEDKGGDGDEISDDFREANIEGGHRICQYGPQQVTLTGPHIING